MAKDFFVEKKPWSIYKDFILGYYLQPYISKVRWLRKPVVIADCFAGPGKFNDGNDGSPLIICKVIKQWYDKGEKGIVGVFIERKKKYYAELVRNISPYKFAYPIKGDFGNYIDDLSQLSNDNTIFLYIDPFGTKELVFEEMEKIFSKIEKNNSVELLMNFDSDGFVRWGCKVLGESSDVDEYSDEKDEEESISIDDLNGVANGEYWIEIIKSGLSFDEKVKTVAHEYANQYKKYFKYVCYYPVKEQYKHIAKYYLIYATRHDDGLLLMNDTMYKARESFLVSEFKEGRLFDTRPPEEEKDFRVFEAMICDVVKNSPYIRRKIIILRTILKDAFCKYNDSDFKTTIKKLLKEGRLFKTKGKIEECEFLLQEHEKN